MRKPKTWQGIVWASKDWLNEYKEYGQLLFLRSISMNEIDRKNSTKVKITIKEIKD